MKPETLYGVWITNADGTNGRWMTNSPPNIWRGPKDEAEMYADERNMVHHNNRYTVKEFPNETA